MDKKLKHRFLDTIISGDLDGRTDRDIIVTTKEFTQYFGNNGKKDYLRCYLPSVTIEAGRHLIQHNKFLFKTAHDTFKIHQDATEHHRLNHKTQ